MAGFHSHSNFDSNRYKFFLQATAYDSESFMKSEYHFTHHYHLNIVFYLYRQMTHQNGMLFNYLR